MKQSPADQRQLEDALDEVLRPQAAVDASPDSDEAMTDLLVGIARVDYIMEPRAINAMMQPSTLH